MAINSRGNRVLSRLHRVVLRRCRWLNELAFRGLDRPRRRSQAVRRRLRRFVAREPVRVAQYVMAGLEPLEPRVLLAAQYLFFDATPSEIGFDLRLTTDGTDLQLVDAGGDVLQAQSLVDNNGIVMVVGSPLDDSLTIDSSVAPLVQVIFDGAEGVDSLVGPAIDSTWYITGRGTGQVGNVSFESVENLVGEANNEDSFVLLAGGSLDGLVDGGAGGFDSLIIEKSVAELSYSAYGPDSGLIMVDGESLPFIGLEPITVSGTTDITVNATGGDDALVIEEDPNDTTKLVVRSTTGTMESLSFNKDAASATIQLGDGDDSLTFNSLGSGVTADIRVVSSAFVNGIPLVGDILEDQLLGNDTITFAQDIRLEGGDLVVEGETISLAPDITISTRTPVGGSSGDVTFTAESIVLNRRAKVLAQADAPFTAGAITFNTSAYSIVRTGGDPPAASIRLEEAELLGGLIQLDAFASERFGVFGFKKNATASIGIVDSRIEGTSVVIDSRADTTLTPPADVELSDSGSEEVVFKRSDPAFGGSPTITRTDGNFRLDGFDVGASITVVDSPNVDINGETTNNDGSYRVSRTSSDGKTLVLGDSDVLVDRTAERGIPVRIVASTIVPSAEDVANEFLTSLLPFNGSAIVSLAETTATTKILGASRIIATAGSVELGAQAEGRATPLGPGLGIPSLFSVAAAYAESEVTAIASVEGTSTVTASNNVTIQSESTNRVTATSMSTARNTPVNLVFAGAKTTSDTQAFSADGTTITSGGDTTVGADSKIDVVVAAAVYNAGASGASLTAAVNLVDVNTDAHVDGDVTAGGDLTVNANAKTVSNITETDASNLGNTKNLGFTDQLRNQTNTLVQNQAKSGLESRGVKGAKGFLANKVVSKLFPALKSGKLNLSGAVTYAETEQDVRATIGTTATVITGGDVSVSAFLTDGMNVSAAGNANSDKIAAGGAVVIADYNNDVDATIDNGAVVTAGGNVRLDAQIDIPFPWESSLNTLAELLAFDFDSVQEVLSFLSTAYFADGIPGNQTFLTSFVRNTSAGSTFGLSGAVEIIGLNNDARAEIRDNARVTSTAGSVDLFARTAVNTMNLTGSSAKFSYSFLDKLLLNSPLVPRINKMAQSSGAADKGFVINEVSQPTAGIGGGVTIYDITSSAVATIGDGAVVSADQGVSVLSDTQERNITVTLSQGKAEKLGAYGAVSLIDVRTTSVAFVEDTAVVDAGSKDLTVRATGDPRIYNFTGGVNNGANIGIGASVGLTNIDSVTKAFIGDALELTGDPTITFEDVSLEGNPLLGFENVATTGELAFRRVKFTEDLNFGEIEYSGDLSFVQVDGGRDYIRRDDGTSWSNDLFVPGRNIVIDGSDSNDGAFAIASVSGSILTLAPDN
ncbi:MAG: beta strand repeat-containing protein, partial [Pirellulales bacterium]